MAAPERTAINRSGVPNQNTLQWMYRKLGVSGEQALDLEAKLRSAYLALGLYPEDRRDGEWPITAATKLALDALPPGTKLGKSNIYGIGFRYKTAEDRSVRLALLVMVAKKVPPEEVEERFLAANIASTFFEDAFPSDVVEVHFSTIANTSKHPIVDFSG